LILYPDDLFTTVDAKNKEKYRSPGLGTNADLISIGLFKLPTLKENVKRIKPMKIDTPDDLISKEKM